MSLNEADIDYIFFAGLTCFMLSALGLLFIQPIRKISHLPWYEQARLRWPAKIVWTCDLFLLPLIFAILPHINQRFEHPLLALAICYFAVLQMYFWGRRASVEDFPHGRKFLKQFFTAFLLFGLGWAVMLVCMASTDFQWTKNTTIAFLFVQCLFLALAFGLGLRIAEMLGLVKEDKGELQKAVHEISAARNIRPPRVLVIDSYSAGAWAFILNNAIGFTNKFLASSAPEEIAAITRHELAHFTESKWTLALRLAPVPIFASLAFCFPLIGTFRPEPILVIYALWISSILLLKKTGRKMENRADAQAAETPEEKAAYGSALLKLYKLNQVPLNMRNRGMHADGYDRLLAAGLKLDFERPKPPPRLSGMLIVLITIAIAAWVAVQSMPG